jgi:hypothetical protein
MPGAPDGDDAEVVSYERWGVDFFVEAVSRERILAAVNTIAGQPIDVGPIGVGPGRIAKVRAYGELGAAAAERLDTAAISYRVELPVDLTFELDLQVETHTYHAQLLVPLILTAHALSGRRVHVEITPPRPSEVQVRVRAEGLRASITQRVANVEGELRRFVAKYVAREVTKPHIESARRIDVAAAIDRAWAGMAPSTRGRAVAADLNEALESEIRENEETFLER